MKKTTAKKTNKIQIVITPEIRALFDGYHEETKQEMDRRIAIQDKKRDKEMKKYIAEQNKKSDEDIKRYIGSVSEEHQARTSVVAEQYTGLNEKIDVLGNEMKEVKTKLDMHTEMIGTVMETMEEIKDELKTKADETEVIHLSRRVSVLEHTS